MKILYFLILSIFLVEFSCRRDLLNRSVQQPIEKEPRPKPPSPDEPRPSPKPEDPAPPDNPNDTYVTIPWYMEHDGEPYILKFKFSWAKGLEESGFTEEDMPFESGMIARESLFRGSPEILWTHEDENTLCRMILTTKLNGDYISVTSSCQIKYTIIRSRSNTSLGPKNIFRDESAV